ncbi:MAG: glycosyltransferase family 4 protein [Bryobacterales bacterium]|nr:glycosyltransferase family 4 protein [Bryobacterales bacterium]
MIFVIFSEAISDSIFERPWLTPCGGATLLALAANRIRRLYPDCGLLFVTPVGQGRHEIEAAALLGIQVRTTRSRSQVSGVREILAESAHDCVVLVPLFGGMPIVESLDSEILGRHTLSGADITLVTGVHEGLQWQVYNRRAISWLWDLFDPSLPHRLNDLVRAVQFAYGRTNTPIAINIQIVAISDHPVPQFTSRIPPRFLVGPMCDLAEAFAQGAGSDLRRRFSQTVLGEWPNLPPRVGTPYDPGVNPRVLFISASSAYSGAEESLVTLVSGLAGKNISCSAVISFDGLFARRMQAAGAVVYCPGADISQVSAQCFAFIEESISHSMADIVHLNDLNCAAVGCIARQRGIPVVQHIRLVCDSIQYAPSLEVASRFVAVSRYAATFLKSFVVSGDVESIHDPIDCVRFDPSTQCALDARREIGLATDAYVIACIARFTAGKNHKNLLHAFAAVRKEIDTAQLLLVGDADGDHEMTMILEISEALGLRIGADIVIIGFTDDIIRVHSAADVVVLCSYKEALGTSILEAMSMEKAVVISSGCGLSELVIDGINGRVVDPSSIHDLAEVLTDLRSKDIRSRLGQYARRTVMERVSLHTISDRIIDVYRNCEYMRSASGRDPSLKGIRQSNRILDEVG